MGSVDAPGCGYVLLDGVLVGNRGLPGCYSCEIVYALIFIIIILFWGLCYWLEFLLGLRSNVWVFLLITHKICNRGLGTTKYALPNKHIN